MGYMMEDWLALHELTPPDCVRLVRHIEQFCTPESNTAASAHQKPINLTAEQAWSLSATALVNRFPEGVTTVSDVRQYATVLFNPTNAVKGRENFTLDRGLGEFPFVTVNYNACPADVLTVVHEFSHAVQLVATGDKFMPPGARELCAFIGERCVIEYLKSDKPDLHGCIAQVWSDQNNRYFGNQLSRFRDALKDQRSPYDYTWNYPIARVLAGYAFDQLPSERVWGIFTGEVSLAFLVGELLDGKAA